MTYCDRDSPHPDFCREDVSGWFELTYASYLVLPRSLMDAMPPEWQHQFTTLLESMRAEFPNVENDDYMVKLRGEGKRFIVDPLAAYRHPDQDAIDRVRAKAG